MRIAKTNLAARGIEFEAERRFQQAERRRAGPGLRRAGDGIEHRSAPPFALESAEQFRQPPQVHVAGGIEQGLEQMRHRMLQAVAREAERDQRIVVRPDRSIVIGHRVVTGFAARHRADAPSRKKFLAHQIGRDQARAVGSNHAGEEKLPGIRRSHLARPLGAVERHSVGAEFLAPERRLEALGKQKRRGFELRRPLDQSQAPGAARRQPLAGKDIPLNLRQRDVALGELPIGMKDRVEGILPALVGKPLLGSALILDESVLVGIAGAVDPLQRRLDRRPQLGQRCLVAGAFDIKAGQQDEQRGRIDTAVILCERHLAQRGHLAAAHLVQDFAGLGVGERIRGLGLEEGEPPQHALGNARIDPQHLQRGNQSVAAERGRIPGNARIRVLPLRRFRHQHIEVGHRLAQHLVEDIVRRLDAGRAAGQAPHLATVRQQAAKERHRLVHDRLVAGYRDEQCDHFLGRQLEMIGRRVDGEPCRPRLEMQGGNACLAVEPAIFQHDIGGAEQPAGAHSPARPALATHLEQIGKIIVEQQRQVEARRPVAVILQRDALVGRAAPKENRAHDVQRVLLQRQPAVAVHVGIGEIDGQRRIVVAQIGAEQQRLDFVEHHLQPGEITRIGVEQTVGPAGGGADIAMAVQHDEGIVVLQ